MSYDSELATKNDLAYVPTTLRGVASAGAPLTVDFQWLQFSSAMLKGMTVVAHGATATDGVTGEAGVEHPQAGWIKIQDLTLGPLALPPAGELTIAADAAMAVPKGVIVRCKYETTSVDPVNVAFIAHSWFPAQEVRTPVG